MEKSKKSRNDHGENKKMLIKIGGGAGGGVGAVVLLGGALLTAALASFFAVRQKSRSSGEDHIGRTQNSSSEIINKSEKDDADIREGAKEDDSTIKIYAQSLKLDDKAMVETDAAISDDGFVIIKKEIPCLAEDQRPEDEKDKVEFTKEDVSEDYSHDQTEADTNVDMDKKEVEGFCNGNEEINAPEKGKVDLSGDAIGDIQGAIAVSERRSEDGEKTVLPLFEGHDIQQDDVEMLGVDEAIVGSKEEKAVEEDGKCCASVPKQDLPVDDVAGELGEGGVSWEVCENSISMQFDAKKNVDKEMEIAGDGATGGDPQKEGEEELIKKKSPVQVEGDRVKDMNDEAALSNEMRSSRTGESNWEALWQAESPEQVKLMKYEVGGKIQEDKSSANFPRVKDYPTNAMRWRMIMWTVCVLSSLSCSCFFNLSFAKLCLVVFLTAFLLEIYGYSLLNRHHAQCLLAAEQGHKKPSNKLANL